MENLKAIGKVVLYLVVMLAVIFVLFVLIRGGVSIAEHVIPILIHVATIATSIDILILVPLAFFRKSRPISAIGLMISSYVFGISVWGLGFLVTYAFWGGGAVFVGLLIFGVGVVPMGIVAALLHGAWGAVGNLLYGIAITYGARFLAIYLGGKIDRDRELNYTVYPAESSDDMYPAVKENLQELFVDPLHKIEKESIENTKSSGDL